jgi:hypothetical protein
MLAARSPVVMQGCDGCVHAESFLIVRQQEPPCEEHSIVTDDVAQRAGEPV